MKRKGLALLLTAAITTSLLAGCGNKKAETSEQLTGDSTTKTETKKDKTNKDSSKPDVKTVKMFQFKVEIAEQLDRMKVDLLEETGINLEIETAGGGADYSALLKAKFASNEYPDIFNNSGNSDLDVWIDKLADLSNEPWRQNISPGLADGISKDGNLYGMPMNIEGYGFIYNIDLFKQAGITTLPTNLEELASACEKLNAIDITPFSSAYQELWVLGSHNFNTAIANHDDPDALLQSLSEGTANLTKDPLMSNWLDLFDLTIKYSQPNTVSIDYNTQVTEFALGTCAMMQQGNWTEAQILKLNPEIRIGLLPMPIQDTNNNSIYVGVPKNWVIYKESAALTESKEVLNWMVTSKTGQRYITDEFLFIPAFGNFEEGKNPTDIKTSILEYVSKGQSLGWYFSKFPSGLRNEVGAKMQAYISKEYGREELLKGIEEIYAKFSAEGK